MRFSLVVPTLGRVREVARLFQSLVAQRDGGFEVILVDQNLDDRLVELVASYRPHFPVLHLRETQRGQSRARNVGRPHVQGQIVAFPDDDCCYSDGLLADIAHLFQQNPTWDGVIVRVYDLDEDKNAFERCGDDHSQEVDYAKAYHVGVSCAMFFRAHVTEQIAFDEALGPGSGTPWGAGDDTEYLFQCLGAGYKLYYDATLHVRHPNPLKKNSFPQQIRREYFYGLGNGYFLGRYNLPYSLLKFTGYSTPSFRLALLDSFKGHLRRASYHLAFGIGSSLGYRAGLTRATETPIS